MTNRREFLHLGIAAISLPIVARAGMSSASPTVRVDPLQKSAGDSPKETVITAPLYKIFFDERFAACAAFAEEMRRRALPMHAIRGDITDVWFNDLYYRWKQQPVAIAGMTAPGPIFCLEMLAHDAGMRVALRVDHRYIAPGRIEHEFTAPTGVLAQAAELDASGEEWPRRMAEIVAGFSAERGAAQKATIFGRAAASGDDPEHLVSWVIAPVRRA